jgi:hypothetical protein
MSQHVRMRALSTFASIWTHSGVQLLVLDSNTENAAHMKEANGQNAADDVRAAGEN